MRNMREECYYIYVQASVTRAQFSLRTHKCHTSRPRVQSDHSALREEAKHHPLANSDVLQNGGSR